MHVDVCTISWTGSCMHGCDRRTISASMASGAALRQELFDFQGASCGVNELVGGNFSGPVGGCRSEKRVPPGPCELRTLANASSLPSLPPKGCSLVSGTASSGRWSKDARNFSSCILLTTFSKLVLGLSRRGRFPVVGCQFFYRRLATSVFSLRF